MMSLFSPSSRSLTRDVNRIVNLRRKLGLGVALLLLLNLGTFAGGVWLGRDLDAAPEHESARLEEPDVGYEQRFAIARVGKVVGRLKTLESDVLALQQMMSE